jgi:ABC-type transport system involved in cytochrome bd biosynthesis fused ATPase/permease subunit
MVPSIVLARIAPVDLVAAGTIALTLPLIPVFMALVGMHTEAANRRQFRLLARLSHHFLDVVAGLPTLRVFGRAKRQAGIIAQISTEQRTVPVAIALVSAGNGYEAPWGAIMAASVIVTLPLIGLVVYFQRQIVAGLTAGSVKG